MKFEEEIEEIISISPNPESKADVEKIISSMKAKGLDGETESLVRLCSFVRRGDEAATRKALAAGSSPNAFFFAGEEHPMFEWSRMTPLMILMVKNDSLDEKKIESLTDILIEGGADVSCTDHMDWTALHYAAVHCRSERIIEKLVSKGANPNAKTISTEDYEAETPLLSAFRGLNGLPTAKALIENGAKADGSFVWKVLKERGGRGMDWLMLLAEAGADFSIRNKKGQMPEEYAETKGLSDIALFLRVSRERGEFAKAAKPSKTEIKKARL